MSTFASDHPVLRTKALDLPGNDRECRWHLLRRRFTTTPGALKLWISASHRCRVFLDGEVVLEGPARSDRERWEVMELERQDLTPGDHLLAIEVVHWGSSAGKGQIGGRPFLLVAGEVAGTEEGWLWHEDLSRRAHHARPKGMKGHYAIGPGEDVDTHLHPGPWTSLDYDDAQWSSLPHISEAPGNPWGNRSLGAHLIPSLSPQMARIPMPWARCWTPEQKSLSLPLLAQGGQRLLFDAGVILNALPRLSWKGGHHLVLRLTWCEAPIDGQGKKGDRDRVEGVTFPGQEDLIRCDEHGGTWTPSWIRSFRYLLIEIEGQGSLSFESIDLIRSHYPFAAPADIKIKDEKPWNQLISINRDTILACTHETTFDCPAYEQAAFPGDARVQVRQHFLVYNEEGPALKAMEDFAASRVPSGLLRSHWPSSYEQVISTYSLQWIGMLHDFWRYRGHVPSHLLPIARNIAQTLLDRTRDDGLLGWIDEAPFIDWAFQAGNAPQDPQGGSSIITAMLAQSLQQLSDLEQVNGYPELAPRWRKEATALLDALDHCWDEELHILWDTPQRQSRSVHAQVQALMAGYEKIKGEDLTTALATPELTQPKTLYYRAHVAEALRKSGCRGAVPAILEPWFDMMKRPGLTTWPESDDNPRSDCHGWGSAPEVEIIHSLGGIEPESAGWETISLDPAPGNLEGLDINITLPSGPFEMSLQQREGQGTVTWKACVPVLFRGQRHPPGEGQAFL